MEDRIFDYIVVGGGSAGCILANRLSENPENQVLLLEAGGRDRNFLFHMPKGTARLLTNSRYTWRYPTEAMQGSAGRREVWMRGKALGGSSSVNGMVYVRGQPRDFAELAARTSSDWDWEHIGRAYAAMERHELGAAATRGGEGPMPISLPAATPLSEAIIAAAQAIGIPRKQDVNVPDDGEAVGYLPANIGAGRRQSASTVFLRPAESRRNLTVVTEAEVDRVLFDGARASGVLAWSQGRETHYRARREIVLSAGAIASPMILMRSGIGPAAHLQKMGIDVRVANENVGAHFHEHRMILMELETGAGHSENGEFRGLGLCKNVAQYLLFRKGALASPTYSVGVRAKSRPDLDRPDTQMLFASWSFGGEAPLVMSEKPSMHLQVHQLRPESEGSIAISSKAFDAPPALAGNFHMTDADRATSIAAFRLARKLLAAQPLNAFLGREVRPGPAVETDADILRAFEDLGECGLHGVGSCRMGKEAASAVVDPRLRVFGVEGLRVMDASVPPQIPAGNTNAPIMAMAWRASELMLEDARMEERA